MLLGDSNILQLTYVSYFKKLKKKWCRKGYVMVLEESNLVVTVLGYMFLDASIGQRTLGKLTLGS